MCRRGHNPHPPPPHTHTIHILTLPCYAPQNIFWINPVQLYCTLCSMQDSVESSERSRYLEFMKMIGWFFFDLFLLGYVEDFKTGLSFRLPGGLQWKVYIEVNLQPHVLKARINIYLAITDQNQLQLIAPVIIIMYFCSNFMEIIFRKLTMSRMLSTFAKLCILVTISVLICPF